MTTSLIIVNGAPATGKSAVAKLLHAQLDNCALLDADDVWRIHPFEVNDRTRKLALDNVTSVIRNYIEAEYDYVILAWVLHRQAIIDDLLDSLSDLPKRVHIFTLVADEQVLLDRLRNDPGRQTPVERAILRLRQTRSLKTQKIDTSSAGPEQVASTILGMFSGSDPAQDRH